MEPEVKRTIAFIDGQNLFYGARECFGYSYPSYDVLSLAKRICHDRNWSLRGVRFYTGVPDAKDNPPWNRFWSAKLLAMSRQGVFTFSRSLRYRNRSVVLPDGMERIVRVPEEKGIDVRIALDIVRAAYRQECDVLLVLSQDQDLQEVAEEVRTIAREQSRWIKIASAYPCGPSSRNRRGINKTDWITIEKSVYDSCIDPRDYRISSSDTGLPS